MRIVGLFIAILFIPIFANAQLSNWIGEYHGAGDAQNELTGESISDRGALMTIIQTSGGKLRIEIMITRHHGSDTNLYVSTDWNNFIIRAENSPTYISDANLNLTHDWGSRIIELELSKQGNRITGEITSTIVDDNDTYTGSTFEINTIVPHTGGEDIDYSYYSSWIYDEVSGSGSITNELTGESINNRSIELSIFQYEADQMRIHLEYIRRSDDPTSFRGFGSSASNWFYRTWNIPASISNNTLKIKKQRRNHFYEINLTKTNNKISGELTVHLMRTNGQIYRATSGNIITEVVTSVGNDAEVPLEYTLFQNYPNPFNPSTLIRYAIPERSHVTLTVFNSLGQKVATLVSEEQEAHFYEITFDASQLPSGVYIYRLQAGEYVESRKMLYLR